MRPVAAGGDLRQPLRRACRYAPYRPYRRPDAAQRLRQPVGAVDFALGQGGQLGLLELRPAAGAGRQSRLGQCVRNLSSSGDTNIEYDRRRTAAGISRQKPGAGAALRGHFCSSRARPSDALALRREKCLMPARWSREEHLWFGRVTTRHQLLD